MRQGALGLKALINNRLITRLLHANTVPPLFPVLHMHINSHLVASCSISHYVIVMSMTIFLMLLSVVTHTFTSGKLAIWRRAKMHFP